MGSPLRTLILGGTTEASDLARMLAGDVRVAATLSLAGRTRAPVLPAIDCRLGGFGGVAGLVAFLRELSVEKVIDATHPFAVQMTRNAVAACAEAGVPLLRIDRPPWTPQVGDDWTDVADMAEAARTLGTAPRRVLLTIGQRDLFAFAAAPWHRYVVRSVERPDPDSLPDCERFIAARGPFDEPDERRLLSDETIEVIVTKNSGGDATVAKLAAARALGVRVVMVARPPAPAVVSVTDAAAGHAWLLRGL